MTYKVSVVLAVSTMLCSFAWGAQDAHDAQAPRVVCIDPGHPSEVNPGYTKQNGTTETHVDWVVAKRLEKHLRQKGFRVVMTKSSESELVRNKDRALIANRAGADILVRLHCDSSTSRGYALYYPDRTGTKEGVTGPSAEVRAKSRQAAVRLCAEMQRVLAGHLTSAGVKGDSQTFIGGKQGVLTGSIFSKVPVVTIEMVVLSNKNDAAFIKTAAGQERMALAIAAGVSRFLDSNPPAGDTDNADR